MADNTTLPGTGDVIADDDIGGIKYQRIKLIFGADGVNSGDVAFDNPLPMGKIIPIVATPTISITPAYAAGDALGGKITLANAVRVSGGSGTINTIVISDLGKQNAPIDVVFFNADPSNTTFTDNAVLDIHDTDLLTIIGVVSVTSWTNFNDNSVGVATAIGLDFKLAGTSLFACLVNRGTPTYTATSDIQLTVNVAAN